MKFRLGIYVNPLFSNNVKVLTAEDHTNKLSVTCKGDIKVFITILTTKKSLKRDEELGL